MDSINFNNAKYTESFGTSKQLPASSLPELVFVGKSNVGKSSLINKLCNNNKLAKVSSSPGKTTTINFFKVDNCYIVDLPGYGFAKRSKSELNRWSELIEGYFNQDRNFALVVSLLDIRHNPTELDCDMINFLHNVGLPFMIVLTKHDKLSKQKANNQKNKILNMLGLKDRIPMLAVSSEKGTNIQELKNILCNSIV